MVQAIGDGGRESIDAEAAKVERIQGTFRDPAGSVEVRPDAVYRAIHPPHGAEMLSFLQTPLCAGLVRDGRLIETEVLDAGGADSDLLLRHPRVLFATYPWEWSPAMWLAAAELTLGLCTDLLRDGWTLKDATPLNVLFQGMKPVLVDMGSVVRYKPDLAIWLPYGQFIRTFLLPMVAYAELGWPLTASMTRRDGYEPEELYAALPLSARVRQPMLSSVTMPMMMSKSGKSGAAGVMPLVKDPELVRHVLGKTFQSLQGKMRKATPVPKTSTWTEYSGTATHYEAADHASKKAFVADVLGRVRPARVLDVGCNSGVYSELAVESGAEVVSVDTDSQTIDQLYLRLKGSGKSILPMVMSLANPSPAIGWENGESRSFLERARDEQGGFDLVLMLAVIHHLLLHDQIPLNRIASFCAGLTRRYLVMEWVPPTDVKFAELVRGREGVFERVTEAAFREFFGQYFRIMKEEKLLNGRILFLFEKAE